MSNFEKISDNIQAVKIGGSELDEKIIWLNVVRAGRPEIEYLRKNFGFDLKSLRATLSTSLAERSIFEFLDNGYIFIILHYPRLADGQISTAEIDFFLGHNILVSVHNNELKAVNDLFNYRKKENSASFSGQRGHEAFLFAEILEKLAHHVYEIIDRHSSVIKQIEQTIFASQQKKAVTEILNLRRNIINCRRIMQGHKDILASFLASPFVKNAPDRQEPFVHLIEHAKNIWKILENQNEIINVLNSTNESLLNFRLSDTMKTLTVFSVMIFPLTLVAAIFSMQTKSGMPFLDQPNNFWLVIILMALSGVAMIWYFKRKKWL